MRRFSLFNKCIAIGLCLIMTLGMVPAPWSDGAQAGFAAAKTAGEQLKAWDLIDGYANGSLGENDRLTRAQMMVILAKLKGESEEAKYFSGMSKYKDVDMSAWYAPYVAYAEFKMWTAGISKTQFGPDKQLTEQEALAFLIKALGYTVPNFEKVGEQAVKLGVASSTGAGIKNPSTRGTVFKYMLNTVYAKTAGDGMTLGSKMGITLGEKPVEVTSRYGMTSAKALSQNLLEVKLTDVATLADKASFVLKDASGNAAEIQSARLMDSKTIWLKTADLRAGGIYDLTAVGANSMKISVTNYDKDLPSVLATTVAINQQAVQVIFSEEMDPATALDLSNYQFDNQLQILGAAFEVGSDGAERKWAVRLKTSTQTAGVTYRLTVSAGMTDLAGNFMKSALEFRTALVAGKAADLTPPKMIAAMAVDGTTLRLIFDEASELDRSTVENIGNYTFYNKSVSAAQLRVLSATLVKSSKGIYNEILLKTTRQSVGEMVEIHIKNIADEFGNVVLENVGYRATFIGQLEDLTGPKLQYAQSLSHTLVKLVFDKELLKSSAEVGFNYVLDKGMTVSKAAQDPEDKKVVYLTTSPQAASTLYKVSVKGVMDLNNNAIGGMGAESFFAGSPEDKTPPIVAMAESKIENGKSYVLVTFSEAVNAVQARNSLQYSMDGGLGQPMEVTYVNATTYKLRTGDQLPGKVYRVIASGIADLSGNVIAPVAQGTTFSGKSLGEGDALKITGAAAPDNQTVTLVFNKPVQRLNTQQPVTANDAVVHKDASDPDNYKVYNAAGTTLVAKPTKAYVAKDGMTVSLRFAAASFDSGVLYTLKANANGLGDDFDNEATALYDQYNLPLETANARISFSGSSVVLKKPRLLSVAAVNTEEVQIEFNMPVSVMPDLASGDISFAAPGKGTLFVNMPYIKPLSANPNVLTAKVGGTLESGINYTLTLNNLTRIRDVFQDQTVDATFGGGYSTFYVPNISNVGPRVVDVSLGLGEVTLTFNEPIDAADVLDYRVGSDAGEVMPTYAEFVDDLHDKVRVYYGVNSVTAGKVYTIRVIKNTVVDNVGRANSGDLTEQFAVLPGAAEPVAMTYAEILDQNTVRIGFNKPVADVKSLMTGSDFILDNMPPGSTRTIVGAYKDGESISALGGALSSTTYVTAVDVQVNKLFLKDIPYRITLDVDNVSLRTKYGTFVEGSSSLTPLGKFDLMALGLTAGINVADADTPNYATATITDALLSSETVKNQYAKVAYAASLSTAGAYNTMNGLSTAYNNADLNLASAKGTPVACNVPGNGTYDIVLFFLDANNRVLGYYLVKNVVVS